MPFLTGQSVREKARFEGWGAESFRTWNDNDTMTLKIKVELSPVFQTALQSSNVVVELGENEGTVKGLLHRLARESEGKINSLLFEEGGDSILSGLMVMVNNRVFTGTALNEQMIRLRDKDKVSLLYFVSGG
ncbi:MAG: MoaD/ThiS family protein [Desulfobacteraceae bacterium]|nr:MoaD/ThiS family protein [Desulfobacteraceae bacterium]